FTISPGNGGFGGGPGGKRDGMPTGRLDTCDLPQDLTNGQQPPEAGGHQHGFDEDAGAGSTAGDGKTPTGDKAPSGDPAALGSKEGHGRSGIHQLGMDGSVGHAYFHHAS